MAATASTSPDPLAVRAPRHDELLRRLRLPLAAAVVLVAAAILTGAPAQAALDVLHRLAAADHAWLAAAVVLEAGSFAGYVVLLWFVAGRATPRFGLPEAYRTTVAGAAATRLLPTAGAGGAALTLWVLRRAGLRDERAPRTLLTFLVVLYAVFLLGVLGAGVAVIAAGNPSLGVPAAALSTAAMAVAVVLGRRAAPSTAGTGRSSRAADARAALPRLLRLVSGVREGLRTLGPAVADAGRLVRGGDARLLGAVAWWGFDVAVLGAAVHAVGGSLALGALVLAYFLGQVANTVPVPGAASSGLVGVLVLLGTDPATAVAAVLCYRVVAIWLPAPAGATALVGLRRTVARWGAQDAGAAPQPTPARGAHAPQPLAA